VRCGRGRARIIRRSGRVWFAAFVLLLATALVSAPRATLAQGFSVSPMFVEATVPAGRTAVITLQIFNSSGLDEQAIEIVPVELGQARNGSWLAFEDDTVLDPGRLSSARAWISLETGTVTVPANRLTEVEVRAAVPRFAAGTYLAALLVRTAEIGEAAAPLRLQFEFLVPIVLTVEGRPARQNVQLSSISLENVTDQQGRIQSTTGVVGVVNAGRSFSRLTGTVQIDREVGENWRRITRYELPERAIIPGFELALEQDIDRRLPPGRYRLRADLFVDGRRIAPLQREFDFEGDPSIDQIAYDTELRLDPPTLNLEALPGGARTNIVAITNPGERSVEVSISAVTPSALRGVAMGGLRGDALSAAAGTQIEPERFTIGPRQRRNVRILSRMPEDGHDIAHYYADIVLNGTYPDGQSAGQTLTALRLRRQDVEERLVAGFERIALVADATGEGHVVTARLGNFGNTHIEPEISAVLISAEGRRHGFVVMDGGGGSLLPMALRDYGAELDLAGVPDGDYLLRLDVRDTSGEIAGTEQRRVRIGGDAEAREIALISDAN
jgi:hypothetical protein